MVALFLLLVTELVWMWAKLLAVLMLLASQEDALLLPL